MSEDDMRAEPMHELGKSQLSGSQFIYDSVGSEVTPEGRAERAKSIDKVIRRDRTSIIEINRRSTSILLLGPSAAGKSTVLKQMKIKYTSHGLDDIRRHQSQSCQNNLLSCVYDVLRKRKYAQIKFADHFLESAADEYVQHYSEMDFQQKYHQNITNLIKKLRLSTELSEMLKRSSELGLADATQYWIENADRVMDDDFIATDQDVLYCRLSTRASQEVLFQNVRPNHDLKVFDVGGQVHLRKKWTSFFDQVDFVLYVAPISSYDQVMLEDKTTNQMLDAYNTFKECMHDDFLSTRPVILFLNKVDLFKSRFDVEKFKVFIAQVANEQLAAKIHKISSCDDALNCLKYIFKVAFSDTNKYKKRKIYVKETHATDTKTMDAVLNAIMLELLEKAVATVL
ncbi:hypothetical protein MIR68_010617 [Amoeboaphelidium protococcarum]|nr:hypothetical protein MIR68_010617 [Amoeboaphelidium protococcarum]